MYIKKRESSLLRFLRLYFLKKLKYNAFGKSSEIMRVELHILLVELLALKNGNFYELSVILKCSVCLS